MKVVHEGKGRLFFDPDPEHAREHFRKKSRAMTPKVMKLTDAIKEHLSNGEYLAIGGFGGVRIPTAAIHEIVRQKFKDLHLSGHTATHDFQILAAGKVFKTCDVAYVAGLEARGVSKNARKYVEDGHVELTEWSNAGLSWCYKAAALGIPFILGKQALGSDGIEWSASKTIECPFTGKKYAAYPALYPDTAVIHVHEADMYGNCLIRGVMISDDDLARAAKRLIITCERLVPTEKFRNDPHLVSIPYFCVDAVCEVPYGSYPGNMPYEYFSDEEHLKEWLAIEKDPKGFKDFLDEIIFNVSDFQDYIERNGGIKKMQELRRKEFLINETGDLSEED
jgi:glutaconate CoA-transferase subunit A